MNVRKLIEKGVDKDAKNYFGKTPLHLCCQEGFENIARYLIESNAEIDVSDSYGKLPIHFAAHNGHFSIFRLLIDEYEKRNIDFINSTDIMGMSLLHFTAMNRNPNNVEMLRILLRKDMSVNSIADDKTSPLHYSCATGNPDMVQLLLNSGADVNVNLKDSVGETPIIYAAYASTKGDRESWKCDIIVSIFSETNKNWNFYLHFSSDRQKVFELLMKYNADVKTINNAGETILFFVARYGGK